MSKDTIKRLGLEKEFKKWMIDINKPVKFRAGDRVMITGKAESHKHGFTDSWVREMDNTIGTVGTIREIDESGNVAVFFTYEYNYFWYPKFVLKKVER